MPLSAVFFVCNTKYTAERGTYNVYKLPTFVKYGIHDYKMHVIILSLLCILYIIPPIIPKIIYECVVLP